MIQQGSAPMGEHLADTLTERLGSLSADELASIAALLSRRARTKYVRKKLARVSDLSPETLTRLSELVSERDRRVVLEEGLQLLSRRGE